MTWHRFAVYDYPTHYFIGPDGIVRARHLGPLTSAQIEERLTSILPQDPEAPRR